MNNIFYKARDMNINKLAAARMRVRYLLDCIDTYLDTDCDVALVWAEEDLNECINLLIDGSFNLKSSHSKNRITEEDIERAKQYPIEQLINFDNRGKALAWCHPDKTPSLSWYKKNNKAACHVCSKIFNPIEVVMHQENCGFYQAVRRLI